MLGHQTASKASWTSRLIRITISPEAKPSSTNPFTAMAASVVLLWGVKSYCFLLMRSWEKTWWFILFINNFSRTFPPVLRRFMGRNLDTSSLFSFPGFTRGISFAVFHLFGKTPLLRQPLYMAVIYLGKISKALLYTPPQLSRLHPALSFYPCFRLHSWFPRKWSLYSQLSLQVHKRVLWLVCGGQCRPLLRPPVWSAPTWAVGFLSCLQFGTRQAFLVSLFVCCSYSSLPLIYTLHSMGWWMPSDCNIPSTNVFSTFLLLLRTLLSLLSS